MGHDERLQLLEGDLPELGGDGGLDAGVPGDELDEAGELGHLQRQVGEGRGAALQTVPAEEDSVPEGDHGRPLVQAEGGGGEGDVPDEVHELGRVVLAQELVELELEVGGGGQGGEQGLGHRGQGRAGMG